MKESEKSLTAQSAKKELPGKHIVSCGSGATLHCPINDENIEVDAGSAMEICPSCGNSIYSRE